MANTYKEAIETALKDRESVYIFFTNGAWGGDYQIIRAGYRKHYLKIGWKIMAKIEMTPILEEYYDLDIKNLE